MKQTNDPKEFRDLSDNPTNDGNGIESRDWEEIRPQGKLRNMYELNEDDASDEGELEDWPDEDNERFD